MRYTRTYYKYTLNSQKKYFKKNGETELLSISFRDFFSKLKSWN